MADTTNTTTVHTAEVVRYDDPVIITERVAVSAFIAGCTDPTRRSYATGRDNNSVLAISSTVRSS